MMKNSYRLAAILYVLLFSAALFAREAQLATIEVQNPEQVYRNGDVVYLSGSNFEVNDRIGSVIINIYNTSKKLIEIKVAESFNLAITDNGNLTGSVKVEGIHSDAQFFQIILNAEKSNVRGTNLFQVEGNSPLGAGSGDQIFGSLTVADNSGDGIAQTSEQLNLSGSSSQNTIFSATIEEFTSADGTTGSLGTTSISFASASAAGGTFSGFVNSLGSYQATAKSIKVFIATHDGAFGGFDFSTSNALLTPDTDPPGLVSATATSSTNIRVVFDEAVQANGSPGNSEFSFTNFGGNISAVSIVGGPTLSTTWDLTVDSNPGTVSGTATIAYVPAGSGNGLEDAAGNEVEATAPAVNISDQVAPSAPTLTGPSLTDIFSGSISFTATAQNSTEDGSLAEIRFQGSANGTTGWTTVATDNVVSDNNYAATYNYGTTYAYYRALAVDNANNTTASSVLGSLSDAYRIAITASETPVFTNQTAEFTITIQNNYQEAATLGFTSTYNLTSDGGGTFTSDDAGTSTITSRNIASGNSTATFYYKQASAGTPTITVTEAGANLPDDNDSQQITVNAAGVDNFDLVVNSGGAVTAGASFSIEVTAISGGGTQTNYTGSHTITITGTATASPDGTSPSLPVNQSVTFTAGVGTVTGVILYDSGETPTLTATDELSNTGTSGAVTVNDAAAVEVIVKSAADGGDGQYSSNVFNTATYQGPSQAAPDSDVDLFAETYDTYGNRITPSEVGSWSSTFGGTGNISFSANNSSSTTATFTAGTLAGTTYSGTITFSSTGTSGDNDATGTITIDDAAPAQVSGFGVSTDNDDNQFVFANWSASSSGDDGTSGSITTFRVRWADEGDGQIDNEAKWDAATTAFTGNASDFSGGVKRIDMSSFVSGNKYFAIRTVDDVGNESPISFTTSTDYSLPVSLTSFQAVAGFGKITLKWETASELNNEGFFIYRSNEENGAFDEPVNQQIISGQGNTNTATTYEYVDENVEEGETYYYKLISRDFDGTIHESTLKASALVLTLPTAFALEQNYPNPFNPSTSFNFTIAQSSTVNLEVYNILGQKVRTLIAGEVLEPGVYDGNYRWDATDDNGNTVSGGIYYYVFSVRENGFRQVRKMVFLK